MNLHNTFSVLEQHFAFSLALALPAIFYFFSFVEKKYSHASSASTARSIKPKGVKRPTSTSAYNKSIQWYQSIFFQLQNLEDHPDVLVPARDELLRLFSQGLSLALKQPQNSILSIDKYEADKVNCFVTNMHEEVLAGWASYLAQRKQGDGPELFGTIESAREWLVQQAPVKLVDGAWLGHVHKITTPFALRGVTKDAWQVLSEEYGDGDLSKHHVYLYRKLLESIGSPLPEGHTIDFVNLDCWDKLSNRGTWEAAVTQLLISLFPNEFLPEILGFNMHFEMITMETMTAAHELKGLGINPYYFLIHIAIDNADSGHTAMAAQAVTRYLEMVRETDGEEATQQAWRRVQAGYLLSESQASSFRTQESPSRCTEARANLDSLDHKPSSLLLDPLNTRMIDIFRAKAVVSQKFHCQSKIRIGGHILSDWLEPAKWEHPSRQNQRELLEELSRARPWIISGSSSRSLLVRELSWGGRMFGAFTSSEFSTLCSWIDNLEVENEGSLYWKFTNREQVTSKDAVTDLQDPVCHHPVLPGICTSKAPKSNIYDVTIAQPEDGLAQDLLHPLSIDRLPDIVTLLFAHIGLLENTVSVPSRTACPLYASILRVLRAQAGFAVETGVVAGMDELRRHSCTSLVDIGLELVNQMDSPMSADLSCVRDVILLMSKQCQNDDILDFVDDILRWSASPIANIGLLLGLALAFVDLKDAIVKTPNLLGHDSRLALEAIVAREKTSLEQCSLELQMTDDMQYSRLEKGFRLGKHAIRRYL